MAALEPKEDSRMPNRACDDRVATVSLRFIHRFASSAGAPGLSSAITNTCHVKGNGRSWVIHSPASRGWEVMDLPYKARGTGEFAAGGMKLTNRLAGGSIHLIPGHGGWAY